MSPEEWTKAADRTIWLASIDRRPDRAARWVDGAHALLRDIPISVFPCYETVELKALARARRDDDDGDSVCPVCLEELTSERWTVGGCCHALCAVCSGELRRCPVCRRETIARKRFKFLEEAIKCERK
jgi:RNA polymerase subunit RPABC4/transcription elongation factor Spt4